MVFSHVDLLSFVLWFAFAGQSLGQTVEKILNEDWSRQWINPRFYFGPWVNHGED
jgi:hypothetical protein